METPDISTQSSISFSGMCWTKTTPFNRKVRNVTGASLEYGGPAHSKEALVTFQTTVPAAACAVVQFDQALRRSTLRSLRDCS